MSDVPLEEGSLIRLAFAPIVAGCETEGCSRRSRVAVIVMEATALYNMQISWMCKRHADEFARLHPKEGT